MENEKTHKHKCSDKSCNTVWEHDTTSLRDGNDENAYDKAHNCPSCGKNQRAMYFGSNDDNSPFDEYDNALISVEERHAEIMKSYEKAKQLVTLARKHKIPMEVAGELGYDKLKLAIESEMPIAVIEAMATIISALSN